MGVPPRDDLSIRLFEPRRHQVGWNRLDASAPARAAAARHRGRLSSIFATAAASSAGFPGATSTPPPSSPMISPQPLSFDTITGVPAWSASSGTRPNTSSSDGYTTTSAAASAAYREGPKQARESRARSSPSRRTRA